MVLRFTATILEQLVVKEAFGRDCASRLLLLAETVLHYLQKFRF